MVVIVKVSQVYKFDMYLGSSSSFDSNYSYKKATIDVKTVKIRDFVSGYNGAITKIKNEDIKLK